MKYPPDVLLYWVERCGDEADLTDPEIQFLENLEDQLFLTGHLTQYQIDYLVRIYTERVP